MSVEWDGPSILAALRELDAIIKELNHGEKPGIPQHLNDRIVRWLQLWTDGPFTGTGDDRVALNTQPVWTLLTFFRSGFSIGDD